MESSNGHAAATQTNIAEPEVQSPNGLGCGCSNTTTGKNSTILISVTPTTGGQFEIPVLKTDTIENVKKMISKKLKVPRDRICLLHRERQLRDGSTVQDNQLVEGSRLTLLPSVETGLLAQRPEQSVMQALESLNDSQVNDFLSGKAPLNLTMRLGDHMMLIQLQLSTISPSTSRRSATASSSSSSSTSSPKKSSCKVHPPPSLDIPIETAAMATAATLCTPQEPSSLKPSTSSVLDTATSSSLTSSVPLCKNVPCKCSSPATTTSASSKPLLDTRALAEASRNLTQTLKQLSSEVLTSKSDPKDESSSCSSSDTSTPSSPVHSSMPTELSSSPFSSSSPSVSSSHTTSFVSTTNSSSSSKRRQGAIIESMHHHGKGVYSGTFSGTLNPALQDKFGRPKRDISTIIHILNDLLCATPQYRAARSNNSTLDLSPASIDNSSSMPVLKSTSGMSTSTSDSTKSASTSSADNRDRDSSVENRATRDKMSRLRAIMQERRQRRRNRAAPYPHSPTASPPSTQWSAKSESRDVLEAATAMDTGESLTPPEPVIA